MDERIAKSTQTARPTARCIVVVPCYNEEARLRPRQFSEFLAEDDRVNFLFVNDGSSDGTLRILESPR
jgi:dolichyl-phosphate beta-glucosyltransferase